MRAVLRNLRDRRGVFQRINSAYLNLREVAQYSPEQLDEYIQKQRLELLTHCGATIPYYREIFRSIGIGGLSDWAKIPILTKAIIRAHADDLQDSEGWYGWVRRNTSGGSTGEPVEFLQDDEYQIQMCAMKRVYDEWSGYHYGEPKVIIWGSERDILENGEYWKVRFSRWLQSETWINAFRLSEESMFRAVEEINKRKPTQILAYVEAISTLCKFIKKKGLVVHSPTGIMTSAGTLYPEIRQEIEETFQASVFNRYGSRELGDMACSHHSINGLYVHPGTHYIEVLNEDGSACGPGESGRIIATCFTNRVMPLLRYDVGDIGVLGERGAGALSGFQVLADVKGRVTDTFITKSGEKIHGEYFTHLLYHRKWVKKFWFHQSSDLSIHIQVVMDGEIGLSDYIKEVEAINGKIRVLMGALCSITWEEVEAISSHASGKYRYVSSDAQL